MTHHAFEPLLAAGWPRVEFSPLALPLSGSAVLLATSVLDEVWVLPQHADVVLLPASWLVERPSAAHQACRPMNPHRLSPDHVRVLRTIWEAGSAGVTDREHPGLAAERVAELRRELRSAGLVVPASGPFARRAFGLSAGAQVWLATRGAERTLIPPAPKISGLLEAAVLHGARAG